MILIIIGIQLILGKGYILKLDQKHYYQSNGNISLEFMAENRQKYLILLQSYSGLEIECNSSLVPIDNNNDNQLYILDEYNCTSNCLQQCNVSSHKFSILLTLYKPNLCSYLDLMKGQYFQNYEGIKQLEIQVDQDSLFIIYLDNILELLDPFEFRIGSLNQQFEAIELKQQDFRKMYKLLSHGNYLLFVIGPQNMVYRIQLHREEILTDTLIYLKNRAFNNNNQTLMLPPRGDTLELYLWIYEGSCKLQFNNQSNGSIQLQKQTTYLIGSKAVYLKPQGDVLLIMHGNYLQNPSHYEPTLVIINNFQQTYVNLISSYPILINQQNTNTPLNISTFKIKQHFYQISMPSSQTISQFKIIYMDLQISNQDIQYLYLSRLQNIKIRFDPNMYQLQRIYGVFRLQDLQDGIVIFSSKPYIVKVVKLLQPKFTVVQLNTVYKFQGTANIHLQACSITKIRINLLPADVECRIYKDSKLKITDYSANPASILFSDGQQYIYILMKYESPFYVQFRSSLHNTNFNILKPAIVQINPYRSDLRYLFNSTLMLTHINQDLTLEHLDFSNPNYDDIQIKTIICILFNNISNIQQIQENKFSRVKFTKYYVFYLQTDFIVLIMQSYRQISLLIEIQQTDISFHQEISSMNIYQNDEICQFSNIFSITFSQGHQFMNLSLCECQKRDCIIKLQPNESEIELTYSICRNISFGLIKIQDYLFSCQSLQNIAILPITGSLNIYRKDNYLRCNDGTCSILLIDNERELAEYQFDFIIVLNQFKSFTNSPLKFVFYNNCTQLLRINTDQQYQILYQLDDLTTIIEYIQLHMNDQTQVQKQQNSNMKEVSHIRYNITSMNLQEISKINRIHLSIFVLE